MARRKAECPAERGERRAETNAVAAYLTALRAPKVPARRRAKLEQRRAQIEQWTAEELSPIREVELIQQRLDVDAELAQIDEIRLRAHARSTNRSPDDRPPARGVRQRVPRLREAPRTQAWAPVAVAGNETPRAMKRVVVRPEARGGPASESHLVQPRY